MRMVINRVVSDLSDAEADFTVEWTFGGVEYVTDMTEAEKVAFEKLMAPYVAVSRRVGGRTRAATPVQNTVLSTTNGQLSTAQPGQKIDDLLAAARTAQLQQVRTWAIEQGLMTERTIQPSKQVQRAYDQTHGTSATQASLATQFDTAAAEVDAARSPADLTVVRSAPAGAKSGRRASTTAAKPSDKYHPVPGGFACSWPGCPDAEKVVPTVQGAAMHWTRSHGALQGVKLGRKASAS